MATGGEVGGVNPPPPPETAAGTSAPPEAPTKAVKRKRPTPAASTGSGTTASKNVGQKRNKATTTSNRSATAAAGLAATNIAKASSSSPPPQHILIIDNGGDTVKFGWNTASPGDLPHAIPNVTARLPQQVAVLVGDQLHSQVQNPNSLLGVTRSMERGLITNLGNQVQVWKRVLDIMQVAVPLHTETAKAFGWKPLKATAPTNRSGPASSDAPSAASSGAAPSPKASAVVPAHLCAVLITVPPFCPRTLLDQIAAVWLHDFGAARIGFACGPWVAACAPLPGAAATRDLRWKYGTACVVDLGWSATHVVPLVPTAPESPPVRMKAVVPAVRRLPLAGRHLTNVWKFHASYRQWNLMDHDWLVQQVLERTGFVSLDFAGAMRLARQIPAGRRPFDREVVLPDFTTTFQVEVRVPAAVQQAQAAGEKDEQHDDDDEEDDSDVDGQEMLEATQSGDDDGDDEEDLSSGRDKQPLTAAADDDDDEDEMDDETPEQIRRRLLRQREEEARRRREQEAEQQVLHVSVERFAIPEALFRPSDVGLPSEWAGLPAAIMQSIEACPLPFQPALWQSIHLVGGLSVLPGLQERLHLELRALAPCEWEICVETDKDPVHQTWLGACDISRKLPVEKWSASREEFLDSKQAKRGLWKRFEPENGGFLI